MVQEAVQPLLDKVEQVGKLDETDLSLLSQLVDLQEAPEPEPDDRVVHSGDEELEAPIVRTKTTSAGYTMLRRNSDGMLKEINNNQLAMRLKEKLPDGKPAFVPPSAPWSGPEPGKLICRFNPLHPKSKELEAIGLRVTCVKANLRNTAEVRTHERKKHKTDYASYEEHLSQMRESRRDNINDKMVQALTVALGGKLPTQTIAAITEIAQEDPRVAEAILEADPVEEETVTVDGAEERVMVGGSTTRSPNRKPRVNKRKQKTT